MSVRSLRRIEPQWGSGLCGILAGLGLLYATCTALSYMFITLGSSSFEGYDLAPGNWDIRKGEHVIVNPAIADYDIVGNYIVGLRLPIRRFECNEGGEFRAILVNRAHYFILQTDINVVYEFTSKAMFYKSLVEIGIYRDVSLDYTEAGRRWTRVNKYYGRVDYSVCTEIFDA